MPEDYNEYEMGEWDGDGLGCYRGVMVALIIQAVVGFGLWYIFGSG